MGQITELLLQFLTQIGGGPGPQENNLVRFGLPAIFLLILLLVAWSRQRRVQLPRERLLVWGFGLALVRELFMFLHVTGKMLNPESYSTDNVFVGPFEHALGLAAVIVISAAFMRYILDDVFLPRRYLQLGAVAVVGGYAITIFWWSRQLSADPSLLFHKAGPAWFLHIIQLLFVAAAIFILVSRRGWLRNTVIIALSLLFVSELLILLNYFSGRIYGSILCPIGNNLHIRAIPIFGYVYFREQGIEKKQAEKQLADYREHLENIVAERTTELSTANKLLQHEVAERLQAQNEILQRNAELAAQNLIAKTISHSLDLDQILSAALDKALEVLDMTYGCILLLDEVEGELVPYVFQGESSQGFSNGISQDYLLRISERAAHASKPIVANSQDSESCTADPSDQEAPHLLVSTPLTARGQTIGALTLGVLEREEISTTQLDLLATIGQLVGIAVENARLYQETERWAAGMARLHELSLSLKASFNLQAIYDKITKQAAELIGCSTSGFFLADEEQQLAVGVSSYGMVGNGVNGMQLPLDTSPILSLLISKHEPIVMEDVRQDLRIPQSIWERYPMRAMLCLPVRSTEGFQGFLFLIEPDKTRRFAGHEIDLLQNFTNRAGIALENAHLHKQLEWAAALQERQRIAAEMHDGLAQTLSYLGLRTDQAMEMLEAGQTQPVLSELVEMNEIIDRAVDEVRQSITSLQETPAPRQSLQEALDCLIDSNDLIRRPATVLRDWLGVPYYLPADHLHQVVHIVQEALLNAQRHAHAQQITITLEQKPEAYSITIEDDGLGFDVQTADRNGGAHFGLDIMKARAAQIGGKLDIKSRAGLGTRINLSWPGLEKQQKQSGRLSRRALVQELFSPIPLKNGN